MQVTNSEFLSQLPILKQAINESDFIAIDTELTGINGKIEAYHTLDTIQERYNKVRMACEYQITQIGIACFRFDNETNQYKVKPFNAFLFPRSSSNSLGREPKFLCQASSLTFLRKSGFDFNQWIDQGVSYLRKDEYLKFQSKASLVEQDQPILIEEKDSEFIQTTMYAFKVCIF